MTATDDDFDEEIQVRRLITQANDQVERLRQTLAKMSTLLQEAVDDP